MTGSCIFHPQVRCCHAPALCAEWGTCWRKVSSRSGSGKMPSITGRNTRPHPLCRACGHFPLCQGALHAVLEWHGVSRTIRGDDATRGQKRLDSCSDPDKWRTDQVSATVLPDRERRHLLQFYIQPRMGYRTRMGLAAGLIIVGLAVQLLWFNDSVVWLLIVSLPFLLVGNLCLLVRGYDLRPSHRLHGGTWRKQHVIGFAMRVGWRIR